MKGKRRIKTRNKHRIEVSLIDFRRFHRWGYAALLGLTLVASLVLNLGFLLSFVGSTNLRQQPHWAFLFLALRDLLVTLVLIPSAIDWLVTNFGMWSGGMVWCKAAGFLDFALAFEYPLLLLAIAFILYTRDATQCCRSEHISPSGKIHGDTSAW